jgi:crotonobetainyl-CoA:carnitine CoA-transferase CaiB-like acyl-CoA transferase
VSGEAGRDFLDEYRGDGPLRDLTVLDFSQLIMGPIATQMMGDLGALVIKIEPPETGEFERTCLTRGRRFRGESPHFLALNRNKLSVLANLKDEADREMVLDLARRSDIVVNNFRPGVMERLGVGYEQLRELNPQIVLGQGTGYGSRGPMAALPGQDLLVQAMSGLAANSGSAGEAPVASGAAVSDAAAGFLFGFSLMAAVHGARATGTAQFVDVSLLGASLSVQCLEAFMYMNMPEMELVRSETGIAAPWFGPPYGFYETSDGWICVSMTPRPRAVELFNLDPELEHLDDDQWYERRDEINKNIAAVLVNRSTDEWLSEFAEGDVWASPLLELDDAVDHPQVEANDFIETISLGPGRGEARAVGLVTQVGSATTAERLPPPLLGEHNEIVAQALGGADA